MGIISSRFREDSDECSVHGQIEDLTLDEDEVTSKPTPSILFDEDGEYHSISNTHNGKPLFRKMYPDDNEVRVARILQAYPHPNLVDIYHVCDEYIDMELLETSGSWSEHDVERAHSHLLKHGVVYMDWKPDNYGRDLNGITKVFDFDSSGVFDKETDTWIYCPPNYLAMRKATEAGHINPSDVDRYTFEERRAVWA